MLTQNSTGCHCRFFNLETSVDCPCFSKRFADSSFHQISYSNYFPRHDVSFQDGMNLIRLWLFLILEYVQLFSETIHYARGILPNCHSLLNSIVAKYNTKQCSSFGAVAILYGCYTFPYFYYRKGSCYYGSFRTGIFVEMTQNLCVLVL